LAKAYERVGDLGRAEEQVRLGMSKEPNDFLATLSLATLLLKRGSDASTLRQAGELLDKAEKVLGEKPTAMKKANYFVVRSAYLVLTDHVQEACSLLNDLLPKPQQNAEAVQLLILLRGE
jgi:hypothetical protein